MLGRQPDPQHPSGSFPSPEMSTLSLFSGRGDGGPEQTRGLPNITQPQGLSRSLEPGLVQPWSLARSVTISRSPTRLLATAPLPSESQEAQPTLLGRPYRLSSLTALLQREGHRAGKHFQGGANSRAQSSPCGSHHPSSCSLRPYSFHPLPSRGSNPCCLVLGAVCPREKVTLLQGELFSGC